MKKIIQLLIIYLCVNNFVQASTHSEIDEIVQNANAIESKITKPYLAEAIAARDKIQAIASSVREDTFNKKGMTLVNQSSNQGNNNPLTEIKSKAQVIIFVSFSMPDEMIKDYMRDAKKIHAEIVIRGLVNNSFKQTFKRLSSLVKESGAGVDLNPLLFDKYQINQVPAFVVMPEGSVCKNEKKCDPDNEFDVIKGNISVSAALQEVSNRGFVGSRVAEQQLSILRNSNNV